MSAAAATATSEEVYDGMVDLCNDESTEDGTCSSSSTKGKKNAAPVGRKSPSFEQRSSEPPSQVLSTFMDDDRQGLGGRGSSSSAQPAEMEGDESSFVWAVEG